MNTVPSDRTPTIGFADYLCLLPPEVVFRHLLGESRQPRRIVSASTVRTMAGEFATGDSLTQRFLALTQKEKLACALAYFCGSTGLKAEKITGFDDKLMGSFLVHACRNLKGDLCFAGFDEFAEPLKPHLAAALGAFAVGGADAPATSDFHPWYCLNDLAVVLGFAASGQLKRTKGGAFSKQTTTSLERLLHASQSSPVGGTVGWTSMLLEYGLRQRLFQSNATAYGTNHDAVTQWLGRDVQDRLAEFVEFGSAYTGGWRPQVLLSALASNGGSWFSLSRFPDDVKAMLRDALRVLTYVGAACVRAQGADVKFAAASAPDLSAIQTGRLVLLPDFTAVIPQETGPDDLYWFLRMATLSSLDRIYHGKVDRSVINESLCQGVKGEDILSRLAQWQAPGNVVETVKEWIREFSRVWLGAETIVISTDERVTRQLESFPALKHDLEPIEAHRVFRVRPHARQRVEEILFSMGFDPRTAHETVVEPDPAPAEPSAPALTPVFEFEETAEESDLHVKTGKYGSVLKALDVNEMLHVLDYAILMGYCVKVEYRGSPGVRAGTFRLRPLACQRGPSPVLTTESVDAATRRELLIKEIAKLGVEEP